MLYTQQHAHHSVRVLLADLIMQGSKGRKVNAMMICIYKHHIRLHVYKQFIYCNLIQTTTHCSHNVAEHVKKVLIPLE